MKRKVFLKLFNLITFLLISHLLINNKTVFASEFLTISAIPDQKPEKLNRLYNLLCDELSEKLGTEVVYKPVTNYPASVSGFRTGDLDLVWFGGLTGVQARIQKPGSKVIAQRDIDAKFHSIFIANTNSKITSIKTLSDLNSLKGKRFTFGSESSTSGRLMPQYFLQKAGIKLTDFKGKVTGFSGSHDATLALVQSGSFEVGVLNEQVWLSSIQKGKVDFSKTKAIWRSPAYADYHWLAQPNLDNRFGNGFTEKLTKTIIGLTKESPRQRKILDLFGAEKFISANENDYNSIEDIARKLGKLK